MKTFHQFLEQVETAQKAAELSKEKSQNISKMNAIASMRHRRHVHGELAHTADYEIAQRKEREKMFNPYV